MNTTVKSKHTKRMYGDREIKKNLHSEAIINTIINFSVQKKMNKKSLSVPTLWAHAENKDYLSANGQTDFTLTNRATSQITTSTQTTAEGREAQMKWEGFVLDVTCFFVFFVLPHHFNLLLSFFSFLFALFSCVALFLLRADWPVFIDSPLHRDSLISCHLFWGANATKSICLSRNVLPKHAIYK